MPILWGRDDMVEAAVNVDGTDGGQRTDGRREVYEAKAHKGVKFVSSGKSRLVSPWPGGGVRVVRPPCARAPELQDSPMDPIRHDLALQLDKLN